MPGFSEDTQPLNQGKPRAGNSWEEPCLYKALPESHPAAPWGQSSETGRLQGSQTSCSPLALASQRSGRSDPACVFCLSLTSVFLDCKWCPKASFNKTVFCEELYCFQRAFGVIFLHLNVKSQYGFVVQSSGYGVSLGWAPGFNTY